MVTWAEFIDALGKSESECVRQFFSRFSEAPIILEAPDAYNDPLGKTRFYKFMKLGLEFGFRAEKLNHVHFFVQKHEGYSAYRGEMLSQSAQKWTDRKTSDELGPATKRVEGKKDPLIGYISPWMKYSYNGYDLRLEFDGFGGLWKVTLMRSGVV
jgi:hypothetical protein